MGGQTGILRSASALPRGLDEIKAKRRVVCCCFDSLEFRREPDVRVDAKNPKEKCEGGRRRGGRKERTRLTSASPPSRLRAFHTRVCMSVALARSPTCIIQLDSVPFQLSCSLKKNAGEKKQTGASPLADVPPPLPSSPLTTSLLPPHLPRFQRAPSSNSTLCRLAFTLHLHAVLLLFTSLDPSNETQPSYYLPPLPTSTLNFTHLLPSSLPLFRPPRPPPKEPWLLLLPLLHLPRILPARIH